jgi:zinc D-Ala-D-Ala carboxypeptidase
MIVVLLLAAVGGWSALEWRDMKVVETAADLTPGDDGGTATTGTTTPTGLTSSTTSPASPTTTAAGAATVEPCSFCDQPVTGDPAKDWATIVVDTKFQLPSTFEPPDLVDVKAAGFDTGDKVRQIIVDDLAALRKAAAANGTPLGLISAYRSYSYQKGLYDRAVAKEGDAKARQGTARPGHSEHQLGTAVDLLAAGSQNLVPAFGDTATGKWLAANAATYGFVISYPDVPIDQACYEFEPWHLRYVGRDRAPTIASSGMTPRAWMLSHAPAQSP